MVRHSRDRFTILFGISLVAITIFLVLDIESGLNLRAPYLQIPKNDIETIRNSQASDSKSDEIVNESEFQYQNDSEQISDDEDDEDNDEDDEDEDNANILINSKQNIESNSKKTSDLRQVIGSRSPSFKDYSDVDDDNGDTFDLQTIRITELQAAVDYIDTRDNDAKTPKIELPTLGHLLSAHINENSTILDKFNYEIKQNELYAEDSETIDGLIHEMATRKISYVGEKANETQITMEMHFDNGMLAVSKPMRVPREQQHPEYERHTADIAAFHLDRLLGFRRAFPVTGRILDVTTEVYELSETELRNTFLLTEPYSGQCFYGNCREFCDDRHPVCGVEGMLEASVIAFFPVYLGVNHNRIMHPWRKANNPSEKAIWELDPKYCEKIKTHPPYNKGRRLLDLIDMAILDFLTGNMDRTHYETISIFGENSFTIHYDNGKGFGRAYADELANLAPLMQCCMIRTSTVKTILRFHNGPKPLSELMRESMASDPVNKNAPVLLEPHLIALDRRVGIILTMLQRCITFYPIRDVLYPLDEF